MENRIGRWAVSCVEEKSIYTSARGREFANIPRWMALFLSREVGKHSLNKICHAFGMTHISGVDQAIKSLNMAVYDDKKLSKTENILIHHLNFPFKYASKK